MDTEDTQSNATSTPLFPPLPPLHSPLTTPSMLLKSGYHHDDTEPRADEYLRVSRYVTHYFHLLACQDLCTHGAGLRDMFVEDESKLTRRLKQVQEWLDELTGHDALAAEKTTPSDTQVNTTALDTLPLHDQLVIVNEIVRQCMVRTGEVSAHLHHIRLQLASGTREDEDQLQQEVTALEDRLALLKEREGVNRTRYESIVQQLKLKPGAPVGSNGQLVEKLIKQSRHIRRLLRHLKRKRKLLADWFGRKRALLMDVVSHEASHPVCPAIAALSKPMEHSRSNDDNTEQYVASVMDTLHVSPCVQYPVLHDGTTQELLRETFHQQKLLDLRVELEQNSANRVNCFLGLLVLDLRTVCLSLRDQWEYVGQQKSVFDSILRVSFEKATLVSACADVCIDEELLPSTSEQEATTTTTTSSSSSPKTCTIESLVLSHMKCAQHYEVVADYLHAVACQVPHFASSQIKTLDPSLQALFHHANDLASFTLYLLPFIESHPAYTMMTHDDHQSLIRVLATYLPPLFASEWSLLRLYHFHCQARVLQACRTLLSIHTEKLKDMLEVGRLVMHGNTAVVDTSSESFMSKFTTPLAALRNARSPTGLHPADLPAPSASFTWDACIRAELTFLEKALWGDLLHVEGVLRESYTKVIERISGLRARVMGRVVKVLDNITEHATVANETADDSDPVIKAICDTLSSTADDDDDQLKGLAGCDPRTAKKAQIAQQVVGRLVTSCQHVSYALFLFEQELSALVPSHFWGLHLLTQDDVMLTQQQKTCPICNHVSALDNTTPSSMDGVALSVGMSVNCNSLTNDNNVTDELQYTNVRNEMMRLFFGVWGDRGRAYDNGGKLTDSDASDVMDDDLGTESDIDWQEEMQNEHVHLCKLLKYNKIDGIDIVRIRIRAGALGCFEVDDDMVSIGNADGVPLSAQKFVEEFETDEGWALPDLCTEIQSEEQQLRLVHQATKQKQISSLHNNELASVMNKLQNLKDRRLVSKCQYDSLELMMLLLHKRVLEAQLHASQEWISSWEREPHTCMISPTAEFDAAHSRHHRDVRVLQYLIDFLVEEKLKLETVTNATTDKLVKEHLQLQLGFMTHDLAKLEAAEWEITNKLQFGLVPPPPLHLPKHQHTEAVDDIVVESNSMFNLSQTTLDDDGDDTPEPVAIKPASLLADEPSSTRKERRRRLKSDRAGRTNGTVVSEAKQQRLLSLLANRKKAQETKQSPRAVPKAPVELLEIESKPSSPEPKIEPKSVPIEPKSVPIEPKSVPIEPKSVPIEPKSIPIEPKSVPSEAKQVPNTPKREVKQPPRTPPVEPKPKVEAKITPKVEVKAKTEAKQQNGKQLEDNKTASTDNKAAKPQAVDKKKVAKSKNEPKQPKKTPKTEIPELKSVDDLPEIVATEPKPEVKKTPKKPERKPEAVVIAPKVTPMAPPAPVFVEDYELEILRQQELQVQQKLEDKRKKKAEKAKKKHDNKPISTPPPRVVHTLSASAPTFVPPPPKSMTSADPMLLQLLSTAFGSDLDTTARTVSDVIGSVFDDE